MKPLETLSIVHANRANVIQKQSPRSLSTDTVVLDLEGSIPGRVFREARQCCLVDQTVNLTIHRDKDHMHRGANRVTGADVSRIELLSRRASGIESMKSQAKKGAA